VRVVAARAGGIGVTVEALHRAVRNGPHPGAEDVRSHAVLRRAAAAEDVPYTVMHP